MSLIENTDRNRRTVKIGSHSNGFVVLPHGKAVYDLCVVCFLHAIVIRVETFGRSHTCETHM